jgi:hypothetical protein
MEGADGDPVGLDGVVAAAKECAHVADEGAGGSGGPLPYGARVRFLPPLGRDLVKNVARVRSGRREPAKFDQPLVFPPIDIASRVFDAALRDELAKEHYVIRICCHC